MIKTTLPLFTDLHEVQSSVHLGDVPLHHLRGESDEQHQTKGHSIDGAADPLMKHARYDKSIIFLCEQ